MTTKITQSKIPFTANTEKLKQLAYNDNVYAWLLLHSYNNKSENHNYIYRNSFTFKQIAKDIHKNEHTVAKRFNQLVNEGIILEKNYYGNTTYIMYPFVPYQYLHSETVLQLLNLPVKDYKEELIKTLAFLLKKRQENKVQNGKINFRITKKEIIETFGHNVNCEKNYLRIKAILTILQGAGIIKFKIIRSQYDEKLSEIYVYYVSENGKASREWLGINKKEVQEDFQSNRRIENRNYQGDDLFLKSLEENL